jgi:hypothetical protein
VREEGGIIFSINLKKKLQKKLYQSVTIYAKNKGKGICNPPLILFFIYLYFYHYDIFRLFKSTYLYWFIYLKTSNNKANPIFTTNKEAKEVII